MFRGSLSVVSVLSITVVYCLIACPERELPAQPRMCTVALDPVSPVPRDIPPVREIDFFEDQRSIDRWIGRYDEHRGVIRTRSDRYVSQGNYSMGVYWRLTRRGELVLLYFPKEWEYYSRFAFDACNPGREPLDFELRIGDYYENSNFAPAMSRFMVRRRLRPGWNRFSFPMDEIARKVRIRSSRKIIRFRLFSPGHWLYLDNMRLER